MTFTEYPAQDREVLWEKRYYLKEIPGALPKVLLAAHSWDYACLPALYGLIQQWKRPGRLTTFRSDPKSIISPIAPQEKCLYSNHLNTSASSIGVPVNLVPTRMQPC